MHAMDAPLLEARSLACTRGERELFRDVSFALGAGSLMHVAGVNGAGKTTLLRMLSGLGAVETGEVLWRGEPLRAQREAMARELVYIGQDRKSTRLNSSHVSESRMPSSA